MSWPIGPHSPWPLRCLATAQPCAAVRACTCANCALWRQTYPPKPVRLAAR